ncbi:uncharacterized protein EHS24_008614 [Apiotrichum porosum]|uniref:Uncharacterized protein n=1 Tax=Apiotrichum porosum TaxID=105984 RepID=A0A427XQT3_9TREE|nr:uncharacterized protein EHS24_008614 [Apiotrichum porosum]RSH81177.1 hypothetical protein EHS24_008614 [Apiotrichum porosum]
MSQLSAPPAPKTDEVLRTTRKQAQAVVTKPTTVTSAVAATKDIKTKSKATTSRNPKRASNSARPSAKGAKMRYKGKVTKSRYYETTTKPTPCVPWPEVDGAAKEEWVEADYIPFPPECYQ